jgi:hypothetical protein
MISAHAVAPATNLFDPGNHYLTATMDAERSVTST